MARVSIRDLEIGSPISGEVYLLAEANLAETKTGSPYLRATLADSSGRIEARYWEFPPELMNELEVGSGVRIYGTVEEYPAGSRQIRIERLAPATIRDWAAFLPSSKRDVEEMRTELHQIRATVAEPYLSQLLDHFFSHEVFEATFTGAPAAKLYHHAYLGGLLEHSLAVARLCSFVAHQYAELDGDLLLTAALLHDVGKTTSYSLGPPPDLTDEGRLVDHVAEGALIVQRAIDAIEGFPQDLRNRLLHAILAHHGALERGSPVVPRTLEALALHHADWMDGDIRGFLDHVESEPPSPDGWTGYSNMFGTRLYPGPRSNSQIDGEELTLF